MALDHSSLRADLRDFTNVFLLAPPLGPRDEEGCISLSSVVPPEEARVLVVTATQTPDDRIDAWEMSERPFPAAMAFVDLGGMTRGGAEAVQTDTVGRVGGERGFPVETISNPGNLTRIGVTVTNRLSEWTDRPERIVVCFRSLTALLQYSELKQVFRFLHEMTRRVKSVGGFAHYHMDPTAHDDQEISRLKTLFDAIVEETDGEWTVMTR